MSNLKKIAPATYFLPQEEGMRVPGLIIATEQLMQNGEIEKPLDQVRRVAYLPGILGYSIAMPDIHWGYGFPIGGVAAMDMKNGVISPGGVGYDINCGVRLAIAPLKFRDLSNHIKKELIKTIYHSVPSGVGKVHKSKSLSNSDYQKIIEKGAHWSIEEGYGFSEDLDNMESHGLIRGGNFEAVSNEAKERARNQLGTIGSGNHFVEIGEVSQIYLPEIAYAWGIEKGQTYILIHSGSRGFGHQICQDTLNEYIKLGFAENLPDRQLVAAPIQSDPGKKYFQAMAAAANFAFNNRQQILYWVREAFKKVVGISQNEIKLIYDVCHNIAKIEKHPFDNKIIEVCVHRKGATRAFGPGHEELNVLYKRTGQPVMVPGDMGRASHIMVGLGNPITWSSACHGAGRAKSRMQASKAWYGKDLVKYMEKQGVQVMASSSKTIAEEMPDAYKDVDDVVGAVQEAGLANMVAKLAPGLVIKG